VDIQPVEILKWVGIVLAAGFVGYFGRYLAMFVIGKMHKIGPQQAPAGQSVGKDPASRESGLEESKLKLEKKRAKAEAKKAKKPKGE